LSEKLFQVTYGTLLLSTTARSLHSAHLRTELILKAELKTVSRPTWTLKKRSH